VRELIEETGLDATSVLSHGVRVPRDFTWKGTRYVGEEIFFLARFLSERPHVSGARMLEDERPNFRGYCWFDAGELPELGGLLEPPTLHQVVADLVHQV
jgi:8-oxo-dGTP pyrophosphatase MutT (NUDIX family)